VYTSRAIGDPGKRTGLLGVASIHVLEKEQTMG
jgi:hypothetical protein